MVGATLPPSFLGACILRPVCRAQAKSPATSFKEDVKANVTSITSRLEG